MSRRPRVPSEPGPNERYPMRRVLLLGLILAATGCNLTTDDPAGGGEGGADGDDSGALPTSEWGSGGAATGSTGPGIPAYCPDAVSACWEEADECTDVGVNPELCAVLLDDCMNEVEECLAVPPDRGGAGGCSGAAGGRGEDSGECGSGGSDASCDEAVMACWDRVNVCTDGTGGYPAEECEALSDECRDLEYGCYGEPSDPDGSGGYGGGRGGSGGSGGSDASCDEAVMACWDRVNVCLDGTGGYPAEECEVLSDECRNLEGDCFGEPGDPDGSGGYGGGTGGGPGDECDIEVMACWDRQRQACTENDDPMVCELLLDECLNLEADCYGEPADPEATGGYGGGTGEEPTDQCELSVAACWRHADEGIAVGEPPDLCEAFLGDCRDLELACYGKPIDPDGSGGARAEYDGTGGR